MTSPPLVAIYEKGLPLPVRERATIIPARPMKIGAAREERKRYQPGAGAGGAPA